MSSSAAGTLFRIAIIFAAVVSLWLASVAALYLLVCTVSGTECSAKSFGVIFAATVAVRMFYPRNVFR